MNSRQRRKERRKAERFEASPKGKALIKAIDDLQRFCEAYRRDFPKIERRA
jgi:hypothetical protein